ncbi:MAG: DUF4080 domain-containing protein [Victivallales bacterium]|nr:DUF4080 domain-containing protein [Victivallales bacterium]
MNITWLTINSSYSHSSLALPLIHQAASQVRNCIWTHVSATIKDDVSEICIRILHGAPDVICAPAYLFNREVLLDVLCRVKVLLPDCKVVVGGPECLGQGASAILRDCAAIDYVCQGDGESGIPPLLDCLANGVGSVQEMPQVLSRATGGVKAKTTCFDFPKGVFPCMDEFFDVSKPFVQVETSRGCPNSCIFCTSANSHVHYKPLEDVRAELTMLRTKGVREIRLLDRTFNMPPHRATALLKMFREEFADIHFHIEIHPAFLTDEIRAELGLANPGQLHLEAGIQTLQRNVLQAIGRCDSPQRALDGLSILCSIPQLAVHADLLSGCPQQSYESLLEDLHCLIQVGPAEIQMEVLKVLYGTRLQQEAAQLKILYSPNPPYDVMCTPSMSLAEVQRSKLLSRMVDVYYNIDALQKAFRLAAVDSAFLASFLAYIESQGFTTGAAPQLKRRFLWLADYCKENENVRDELAISWLKEAFTPGEGPSKGASFVSELPSDISLLEGDTSVAARPGSHIVRFKSFYFVYNRALAPNKAVGVARM